MVGTVHTAEEVNLHHPFDDGQILQPIESGPHGNARVVDQSVNATVHPNRALNQVFALRLFGNIGRNHQCFAITPATFGCHFLQFLGVASCQCEPSTLVGKRKGQLASNARRCSRDDDDVFLEMLVVHMIAASLRVGPRTPYKPWSDGRVFKR